MSRLVTARQLVCLEWRVTGALREPSEYPVAFVAGAVEFQEPPLAGVAVCPVACWDSAFRSREDAWRHAGG